MPQATLYAAPLPFHHDGQQSIHRVLVSNRGEIAVRIIESCHRLGLETVAVFTDIDAEAPHVGLATQSVFIGSSVPSPLTPDAPSPYLRSTDLIDLALRMECDAIHPGQSFKFRLSIYRHVGGLLLTPKDGSGYGYLSENAEFADSAVKAGLTFIGPRGESIRTIGDKAASKAFLKEFAGDEVPLVPGYSGADQRTEVLEKEGRRMGYPLLIKASAGGGGKGMRIVREESALKGELERAASESKRSFGDARLLLEKYVDEGKHIEVQIFGDKHGNVYSFFERECSVQRRHQKIIEECPSPALSTEQREKISASARKIGHLLSYEGAGTVEFIFDCRTGEFFFLEVNTRLQVEHPITEMTTGLDLVALQLFVAGGGDLSTLPAVTGVQQVGHAIEARLCAEDAFAEFAPRTGLIRLWIEGLSSTDGVRVDTGVQTGSEVTVFFDPMLAKLIVHAPTRLAAITKLASLLRSTVCLGLTTNQPFLLTCLSHPSFLSGEYTTSFIPTHIDALLAPSLATLSPQHTTDIALATSIFLRHLRSLKTTPLKGISNAWTNNPIDVTRLPLEHVSLTLPDTTTVGLKLELSSSEGIQKPFDPIGISHSFRSWSDVPLLPLPPKSSKKSTDKKPHVANFYNGIASRDGLEDRPIGEWKSGVPPSSITSHLVSLTAIRLHESTMGGERWIHGYVRLSIQGVQETYFLSTVGEGGEVWVHSRRFGGGLRVCRRDLLTFAGELDKRVAGEVDAGGEGAKYAAVMPCRILEVVANDGDKITKGDVLLVMESMKTEIRLMAKADGKVRMLVAEGDICSEGTTLCEIVEESE